MKNKIKKKQLERDIADQLALEEIPALTNYRHIAARARSGKATETREKKEF